MYNDNNIMVVNEKLFYIILLKIDLFIMVHYFFFFCFTHVDLYSDCQQNNNTLNNFN